MATLRWRGDAPAVAQVTTATPANVEVGDQFSLTINGKTVSYTAAAATVADVVAGLAGAVGNSEIPEFAEITASDTTTEVTLTATTAGRPFSASGSTVNGGASDTQTLTVAEVTASQGPNHWDTAANWDTASVPVNGDDVYVEDSDVSILYGLSQSAVTLDSLHVEANFTGEIGLTRINSTGSSDYIEYRPRYLAIGATNVQIGDGLGAGSGRIQLDTGSATTSITVLGTGIAAEDDLAAFLWKGDQANNVLDVLSGSVGVALFGGETATIATLRHAGGNVRTDAGVTLGAIERSGSGRLVIRSAVAAINQSSGETVILGSGAVASINLVGGRIDYRSSGTITTATVDHPYAKLDFSGDLRGRVVSSLTLKRGTIADPHQTVTWPAGIQPHTGIQAV